MSLAAASGYLLVGGNGTRISVHPTGLLISANGLFGNNRL